MLTHFFCSSTLKLALEIETAPLFFRRGVARKKYEINYAQENPNAVLRHEHAATMRLQLEEPLGTFNGFFFVTLYLNEAVQRVTFGYIMRSSSFNDVRMRLHILQPYAQPGTQPSNYFNFSSFLMPQKPLLISELSMPLQHSELIEYSKILTFCCCNNHCRQQSSYSCTDWFTKWCKCCFSIQRKLWGSKAHKIQINESKQFCTPHTPFRAVYSFFVFVFLALPFNIRYPVLSVKIKEQTFHDILFLRCMSCNKHFLQRAFECVLHQKTIYTPRFPKCMLYA